MIMRFFRILLFAGALMFLVGAEIFAQYTTPSSFWLSPQLTAPTAMSGHDYHQISAHYQKQALSANLGSRSMILSGQFPLYGKRNTQFGTVGLNILREESGASYLLSTSGALFTYNYTVNISNQHHLVGGLQAGYFARRLDWTKVTTRNQFADGSFNPGLDHGEGFSDYQSYALTTNIGLAYYLADRGGEQILHVGAGMINANKGRFTYLENDDNLAEPVKWIAYTQLRLFSSPSFDVISNMYWQQESSVSDFVGGLQLRKGLDRRKTVAEEHLGVGLYYSPDHTATMGMQMARQQWLLGANYSLPIGDKILQRAQSTVEVTIGWRMQRAGRKRSFYSGNYRGRVASFQPKKHSSWKPKKKTLSRKFKLKNRIGTASSKSFSKKVSSYKYKVKKRKPSYRYRAKLKSAYSSGMNARWKGASNKSGKIKKWKPKKRSHMRRSKRMFKS